MNCCLFEADHSRVNHSGHHTGAKNDLLADEACEEGVESVSQAAIRCGGGDVDATIQRIVALIDIELVRLIGCGAVVATDFEHLDAACEVDCAGVVLL